MHRGGRCTAAAAAGRLDAEGWGWGGAAVVEQVVGGEARG